MPKRSDEAFASHSLWLYDCDGMTEEEQKRVLLAGLPPLMADVKDALSPDFTTLFAHDLREAERRLAEDHPDCVVVAYHFDYMQAIRLVRYVREQSRFSDLPIFLVCVLDYDFGTKQENVSRAYKEAGVDMFINLRDEMRKEGTAIALARFRASVLEKVRFRGPPS